jgi:hypothetical protein
VNKQQTRVLCPQLQTLQRSNLTPIHANPPSSSRPPKPTHPSPSAKMSTPNPRSKRFAIFSQSSLTKPPRLVIQTTSAPVYKPHSRRTILPVAKTAVRVTRDRNERSTSLAPPSSPIHEQSSEPNANHNPPKVYGNFPKPVKYSLAPGNQKTIGSRAYYRTWAFRKRKYERREREAEELGPVLDAGGGGKKAPVPGEGRRKVDERWRRYIGRL